jgi:pimeloyl-ACP methyl ester carboxylesterase
MDQGKTIEFQTEISSSRMIRGTLHTPNPIDHESSACILMIHGFLGYKDWSFFPWLAQVLAEAGFPTIRFNFSGTGMTSNDGIFSDLGSFEKDTLSQQMQECQILIQKIQEGQVIKELDSRKNIYLWGHSRGGALSFIVAALTPEVKKICTWATIAHVNRYSNEVKQSWKHQGFLKFESSRTGQTLQYLKSCLEDLEYWELQGDIKGCIEKLSIPILAVHGQADYTVPFQETQELAQFSKNMETFLIPEADHKFNSSHPFKTASNVLQQATQKTVRFFRA